MSKHNNLIVSIIVTVSVICIFIIYQNYSPDNFRNRRTKPYFPSIYFNNDIYSVPGSVGNPNIIHGPGCNCGCHSIHSQYGNSNYVNQNMSEYFKQYLNMNSSSF